MIFFGLLYFGRPSQGNLLTWSSVNVLPGFTLMIAATISPSLSSGKSNDGRVLDVSMFDEEILDLHGKMFSLP